MYSIENDPTCPCKGGNLSKFIQPVILSILMEDSMNGYRIIKEMEHYATFDSGAPDATGIYRYLKGMEKKYLVAKEDDGQYRITGQGKQCLETWKATIDQYIKKLQILTQQL